jgi:integrase
MTPQRFKVLTDHGSVKVTLEWPAKSAAWYYRFIVSGRRFYKSTKSAALPLAREIAKKAATEAAGLKACATTRLPIATAVQMYLTARWPESNTKNRYYQDVRNRLNRFANFRNFDLAATNKDQFIGIIQDFLTKRTSDGVGPTTIGNDQRCLSKFCVWLGKRKPAIVPWKGNPASAREMELPSAHTEAQPPLNRTKQLAFINAAIGSPVWPVAALCLGAGLRPIEATRCDWSKIDLEGKMVTVFAKRRGRVVPLPAGVVAVLEAIESKTGKLFNYAETAVAHNMVQDLRQKHGLSDDITLQAMRRTAAFRISREVDLMTYATIMGHSLAVAQKHYLDFRSMASGNSSERLHPNEWPVKKSESSRNEASDDNVSPYERTTKG